MRHTQTDKEFMNGRWWNPFVTALETLGLAFIAFIFVLGAWDVVKWIERIF